MEFADMMEKRLREAIDSVFLLEFIASDIKFFSY